MSYDHSKDAKIEELEAQIKLLTFEPVLGKLQAQNEALKKQIEEFDSGIKWRVDRWNNKEITAEDALARIERDRIKASRIRLIIMEKT